MALLYWPGGEFMYLVLTTSTGEAITVVTKPAPNADTKWHGRLSVGGVGESNQLRVRVRTKKHNPEEEGGDRRSLSSHGDACLTFVGVNRAAV